MKVRAESFQFLGHTAKNWDGLVLVRTSIQELFDRGHEISNPIARVKKGEGEGGIREIGPVWQRKVSLVASEEK